ncbi:hypothetical protein HanIR_Chr11g0517911 [Helianthus annuus]|nr:hypothetical protein HanIR_Chr11g0517911 [Helianthus annuus]
MSCHPGADLSFCVGTGWTHPLKKISVFFRQKTRPHPLKICLNHSFAPQQIISRSATDVTYHVLLTLKHT